MLNELDHEGNTALHSAAKYVRYTDPSVLPPTNLLFYLHSHSDTPPSAR